MSPTDPVPAGRGARLAWPGRAALGLIHFYQRRISPLLPALFGPTYACRFVPSCSEYAAGAVAAHGVTTGCWLAVCRLACCQPFHRGGYDPVPPRRERSQSSLVNSGAPTLDLGEPRA